MKTIGTVSMNLCPACGRSSFRACGSKAGFNLLECGECGVLMTDLSESGPNLDGLYETYYDHASFQVSPTAAESLDRLVTSASCHRVNGNWLDIGFGEGALLSAAERRGWICHGIDIAPGSLSYGRSRGWMVTGDLTDPAFRPGAFDVVTMVEFLEHTPAPTRYVEWAKLMLRPGGLLFLTTPNARSLNRRILDLDWSVVAPPEHVVLWTAKGLIRLLDRSGFRVKRVRTEAFNPAELVARLSRAKSAQRVPDRNRTGAALNAALSNGPLRRGLKTAINSGLNLLRIGDRLKAWAVTESH